MADAATLAELDRRIAAVRDNRPIRPIHAAPSMDVRHHRAASAAQQCAARPNEFRRGLRSAHQYGSRVKMNVVPVTIGALAPTNDTLTSLT